MAHGRTHSVYSKADHSRVSLRKADGKPMHKTKWIIRKPLRISSSVALPLMLPPVLLWPKSPQSWRTVSATWCHLDPKERAEKAGSGTHGGSQMVGGSPLTCQGCQNTPVWDLHQHPPGWQVCIWRTGVEGGLLSCQCSCTNKRTGLCSQQPVLKTIQHQFCMLQAWNQWHQQLQKGHFNTCNSS